METTIRTPAVTAASSRVAAVGEVRRILVDRQRSWVAERGGAAVVEGRDIGSVVFPDAELKIYVTADAEERTRRRAGEIAGADHSAEVAEQLARRDRQDTARVASPLRRVPDAMVIDTTTLSPEQVAAKVLDRLGQGPLGSRENP